MIEVIEINSKSYVKVNYTEKIQVTGRGTIYLCDRALCPLPKVGREVMIDGEIHKVIGIENSDPNWRGHFGLLTRLVQPEPGQILG